MTPSGRNEGPIVVVVVVDESSKSPLFDGSGQFMNNNKQLGNNGVAMKETCEGPANHDEVVEGFGEKRRYPTREQRLLGE